jgi:hypothetical protein
MSHGIISILYVIKDAGLTIVMAATLDRIERGGDEKWHRIIFLALLCIL